MQRGLAEGGSTAIQVHQLEREAIVRMERLSGARGRRGAASKVAALLCTLSDTLGRNNQTEARVPAHFLQRDLAGLLSMRHESICRVMREFDKQGLIGRDGDGILLADRERLQTM